MNEKLPPLPAPAVMGRGDPDGDYSREQVEAIRREAVMLCARIVDSQKPLAAEPGVYLGREATLEIDTLDEAASAIRALLEAPDSRGQSEPARSNEHADPVVGVVLPSQSVRIGGEGEKE